jgi:TatD DNase family protein
MIPAMVAPRAAPREAPPVPLVDTHAHLSDQRFASDLHQVIGRATARGVGAFVVVGYDLASSHGAVRLADAFDSIWAAVGIHPHRASAVDDAALARLRSLAGHPKVIGLGECGLDFYRDLSPRPAQRRAFAAQLRLAAELNLPVIVHSREAMDETISTLATQPLPLGGVLHCFDGTARDAQRAVDLGMHISCAGPITYRRDRTLANAIASVPDDRLVLETDCPYLSPAGHRGERNEPAHVRLIAEEVAAVRGSTLARIAAQTSQNAATLFRTPDLARRVAEQVA